MKKYKTYLIILGLILVFSALSTTAFGANWVDSGGISYQTSGNVGIGTAVPGSPLEVSGKVRVAGTAGDDAMYITNTSIAPYGLAIDAGVGTTYYALSIRSAAAVPLFVVQGGGNVGIGTTTPATILDVDGDITDRSVLDCAILGTDSTGKIICSVGGSFSSFSPTLEWALEFFFLFIIFLGILGLVYTISLKILL